MRKFVTGTSPNSAYNKNDYEGCLSPLVLEAFGNYMTRHRIQSDGKSRSSDSWQKGMSKDAYIKSAFRHFMDWWKEHRGHESQNGIVNALCALMFNIQGYLHEYFKECQQIERNIIINQTKGQKNGKAIEKKQKKNQKPRDKVWDKEKRAEATRLCKGIKARRDDKTSKGSISKKVPKKI